MIDFHYHFWSKLFRHPSYKLSYKGCNANILVMNRVMLGFLNMLFLKRTFTPSFQSDCFISILYFLLSTPKDVKLTYFFIQKSADEEDIEFLMI